MDVSVKSFRTLALAGALLVAALTPTSAAAAVQYVSKTATDASRSALKVSCPAGTHVTGGGEENENGYAGLFLLGSEPFDGPDSNRTPDDGWKVTYDNVGGNSVTVHAVCAAELPTYVGEKFTIESRSQGKESAECGPPNKPHLYSGGARGGRLVSLAPRDDNDGGGAPDDLVRAGIDNTASQNVKAKVWAICGSADPAYRYRNVWAPPHTQSPAFRVECDPGVDVIGGFVWMPRTGVYNEGLINSLFPIPNDGWGAHFDNLSSIDRQAYVFTVCENLP